MAATARFVGERLRDAREARGKSAIQLADVVGVTKQSIHQYEKDIISPGAETFETICKVLRFPKLFFFRRSCPRPTNTIFYRSMSSATRRMRDKAERRFDWFRELIRVVGAHVELPNAKVLDINPPSDPSKITDEKIEEAALSARQHWGLSNGVISDIITLFENNGVLTSSFELEADELDGFSTWDDYTGHPLIVLGSDKYSAVRMRFNAAHELGHLILHKNITAELLEVDKVFNRIEKQAHLFARAFLLPAPSFSREYVTADLSSMLDLKEKWRVSIGAAIFRAQDLNLLTEHQAKTLWYNRTRKGWNKCEPFDDEWEMETPKLISKSVRLLIESGTVQKSDIVHDMTIFAEDIESVANLDRGFLTEKNYEETSEHTPRLLPFRRNVLPRRTSMN